MRKLKLQIVNSNLHELGLDPLTSFQLLTYALGFTLPKKGEFSSNNSLICHEFVFKIIKVMFFSNKS